MRRRRQLWFAAAALCVGLAIAIFAGRTMLIDMFSNGVLYRMILLSGYLLLAGAAGSLTRAFTVDDSEALG
ncbi:MULTISPECIES: hypothetical protein [unclassified Arthrobacter]|uniref:hypothetical protein n=1 Tax=unclassified Arthrobacter TaxID=235627 RepID=UPI001E3B5C62|nr:MULTISPECIES: hypothetical protein [unclassified Arthrobacter]MCC9145157.1 hypothetical protein [Arthrobacter sp. zg-Y919]MDK1276385.1 hypothetical protein [Arthrobacter sp. zg.Y919]WIB02014.1 hypothetical protein QNO10_08465 [Arthrobacter sp. zg-Y919]